MFLSTNSLDYPCVDCFLTMSGHHTGLENHFTSVARADYSEHSRTSCTIHQISGLTGQGGRWVHYQREDNARQYADDCCGSVH